MNKTLASDLMTQVLVAKRMGCTRGYVSQLIRQGKLSSQREGNTTYVIGSSYREFVEERNKKKNLAFSRKFDRTAVRHD